MQFEEKKDSSPLTDYEQIYEVAQEYIDFFDGEEIDLSDGAIFNLYMMFLDEMDEEFRDYDKIDMILDTITLIRDIKFEESGFSLS
jgi:hypothetical protein